MADFRRTMHQPVEVGRAEEGGFVVDIQPENGRQLKDIAAIFAAKHTVPGIQKALVEHDAELRGRGVASDLAAGAGKDVVEPVIDGLGQLRRRAAQGAVEQDLCEAARSHCRIPAWVAERDRIRAAAAATDPPRSGR